jgi:hypothetical protein
VVNEKSFYHFSSQSRLLVYPRIGQDDVIGVVNTAPDLASDTGIRLDRAELTLRQIQLPMQIATVLQLFLADVSLLQRHTQLIGPLFLMKLMSEPGWAFNYRTILVSTPRLALQRTGLFNRSDRRLQRGRL